MEEGGEGVNVQLVGARRFYARGELDGRKNKLVDD